jgi:hypothetical protein
MKKVLIEPVHLEQASHFWSQFPSDQYVTKKTSTQRRVPNVAPRLSVPEFSVRLVCNHRSFQIDQHYI